MQRDFRVFFGGRWVPCDWQLAAARYRYFLSKIRDDETLHLSAKQRCALYHTKFCPELSSAFLHIWLQFLGLSLERVPFIRDNAASHLTTRRNRDPLACAASPRR